MRPPRDINIYYSTEKGTTSESVAMIHPLYKGEKKLDIDYNSITRGATVKFQKSINVEKDEIKSFVLNSSIKTVNYSFSMDPFTGSISVKAVPSDNSTDADNDLEGTEYVDYASVCKIAERWNRLKLSSQVTGTFTEYLQDRDILGEVSDVNNIYYIGSEPKVDNIKNIDTYVTCTYSYKSKYEVGKSYNLRNEGNIGGSYVSADVYEVNEKISTSKVTLASVASYMRIVVNGMIITPSYIGLDYWIEQAYFSYMLDTTMVGLVMA